MRPKIRLCVDQPLGPGQSVQVTQAQAHYLFGVMRQSVGDAVALFNGRDGEWRAEVSHAAKRAGTLTCTDQTKAQDVLPDLWLLFAPIKKARTDFIVEKAAEMGVRRIVPVQTAFTNADRIRQDRLQAHALEAAEQCGNTIVAEVTGLERLDKLLQGWDPARQLVFCDEGQAGAAPVPPDLSPTGAVLIGPEGGFSEAERARLLDLPFVRTLALGPRILRADTAAVAALTLWQQAVGDWAVGDQV